MDVPWNRLKAKLCNKINKVVPINQSLETNQRIRKSNLNGRNSLFYKRRAKTKKSGKFLFK